jgi:hypothetical protein
MMFKRSPEFERIIPTIAVLFMMGDKAIAQQTQQPQQTPPAAPSDPFTTYGVAAALVISMGGAVVNLIKNYIGTVSERSKIELKAQESQNERSQHIATIMMRQQETLVTSLAEDRKRDREKLESLVEAMIAANMKTAEALESLSALIRSKL